MPAVSHIPNTPMYHRLRRAAAPCNLNISASFCSIIQRGLKRPCATNLRTRPSLRSSVFSVERYKGARSGRASSSRSSTAVMPFKHPFRALLLVQQFVFCDTDTSSSSSTLLGRLNSYLILLEQSSKHAGSRRSRLFCYWRQLKLVPHARRATRRTRSRAAATRTGTMTPPACGETLFVTAVFVG